MRYAVPEEIAARLGTVSIAHYCAKTATADKIREDVAVIARSPVSGIQFNISDPDRLDVAVGAAARADSLKTFIFQMNKPMRRALGDKPVLDLFSNLRCARDCHVLLDMSGGKGDPLDIDDAIAIQQIAADYELLFGVAGGLSTENVDSVFSALGSRVSVDAESRLRNDDDTFCPRKTSNFLAACGNALANQEGDEEWLKAPLTKREQEAVDAAENGEGEKW